MLIRHCAQCGREIKVSLPYSPTDYVYYGTKKKWYCTECFTALYTSRILNGGWFERTKDYVLQEVSKDNLDRLFKTHYDVSLIPQYIYIKLDQIYKGTYKGLAQPIPPHELLDILERKMEYLDKNAVKKNLTGVSRINYDLAVAIGSYKSYKEWQSKMQAEQEAARQEAKDRQGYSYQLKGYVPPDTQEPESIIIEDED